MVKPVKFTQDSGCPAHDEFLVNFKGDHIYVHICNFVIVGHCITLHYIVCVGHFQTLIISGLCRLKTYLRSTMGQQRVSNIALTNIERKYANSVVNSDIIDCTIDIFGHRNG